MYLPILKLIKFVKIIIFKKSRHIPGLQEATGGEQEELRKLGNMEIERQRDSQIDGQMDRQVGRVMDRQVGRQMDRWIDRQMDRWIDRHDRKAGN